MVRNTFVLLMALALLSCARAGGLPKGETGNGETAAAFYDLCVISNDGDGPSLFSAVRKSGYEIDYEVVQNHTRYEAKAFSSTVRHGDACPIHVSMEDRGADFVCTFAVSANCRAELSGGTGPFLKAELEKLSEVSFDMAATDKMNERFNDDRYHVLRVEGASVKNDQIVLTYGGGAGSSVYLTTRIEPNHDFRGVMSAEEAQRRMLETISNE